VIVLAAFVPVDSTQDKTTFPTDDEIELLVTQADRAVQQYKPLVNEEELQSGNLGAEARRRTAKLFKLWDRSGGG
jgi:hypothetical protein